MDSWVHRKEEESYLGQLEQLLVQRLQCGTDQKKTVRKRSRKSDPVVLNRLSLEMNEELDRLESLISQEQSRSPN